MLHSNGPNAGIFLPLQGTGPVPFCLGKVAMYCSKFGIFTFRCDARLLLTCPCLKIIYFCKFNRFRGRLKKGRIHKKHEFYFILNE